MACVLLSSTQLSRAFCFSRTKKQIKNMLSGFTPCLKCVLMTIVIHTTPSRRGERAGDQCSCVVYMLRLIQDVLVFSIFSRPVGRVDLLSSLKNDIGRCRLSCISICFRACPCALSYGVFINVAIVGPSCKELYVLLAAHLEWLLFAS